VAPVCHPSPMADDAGIPRAPTQRLLGPDPESQQWLDRLASSGPERGDAIQALFELLHRAALSEAQRRRGSLPAHVAAELGDLARQAADDALTAILRKLDDYRGASRFTTWAYKFAVFEVSSALRREAWRGRTIRIGDEAWGMMADRMPVDPQVETDARELLTAVRGCLDTQLTPRQRDVFLAVVALEVPVDVVAERQGSTRGAIYKVLHDARRKMRMALDAQGWSVEGRGGAS
jgi:RNA polymerase sigma-70 factor (ECF subfamily)